MLDIKAIKADPQRIKDSMRKRCKDVDIDGLLALDETRRDLICSTEQMKAEQNAASKKIPQIKKDGGDAAPLMEQILLANLKLACVFLGI